MISMGAMAIHGLVRLWWNNNMKKMTSIIIVVILVVALVACNKPEQVNIYGVGEEVSFSYGTIALNESSTKNGGLIEFCFTIDLEQGCLFDDLFSRYDIAIDNEGFVLREKISRNAQENEIVNHKTDYTVYINDVQVAINDLTNVQFTEGITNITFNFSENYNILSENEVSFTLLNDEMDLKAVFMM